MSKASKKSGKKAAETAGQADKSAAAEPSAAVPDSAAAAAEPQNAEDAANGANSPSDSDDTPTETPAADSADPLAQYDAETLRDMYVRAAAEKENLAKRAAAEIRKAHDFALQKFAPGICEVRDCLEKALADSDSEKDGKAREGVELTLRKLIAVMEANGILPVRPDAGAAFDTNLHQAAGFAPGEENARTVSEVMQCGYTLNGRLIRPAIVRLGKPPAAGDFSADSENRADNS